METKILEKLAQLVLPKEILERFLIVKIETDEADIMPEFARRYFDIERFTRDLFAYDYTFCDGYVFSDY